MTKKILHIIFAEKFIEPFIEFLESNVRDFDRHIFFIFGNTEKFLINKRANVIFAKEICNILIAYSKLIGFMYSAEKVVIHGLWDMRVIQILAFNPWLLKKSYWIIWGGDLYVYELGRKDARYERNERYRRFVIKNMGHVIGSMKGEYLLAQKWYSLNSKWHECFVYPTKILNIESAKHPLKNHDIINIQIGNSATDSNRHRDAFSKIAKFKHENIILYAPLSYGDKEYCGVVEKIGTEIFGDKFVGIKEFMPLNEYVEWLSCIDIAVFPNIRQQAVNNICILLAYGKKVYLRSDGTMWDFFVDLGVKVYDIEFFDLNPVSVDVVERNIEIMKRYFSVENLINQYNQVLG